MSKTDWWEPLAKALVTDGMSKEDAASVLRVPVNSVAHVLKSRQRSPKLGERQNLYAALWNRGKSYAEIAEATGVKKGTICRAIDRLRRKGVALAHHNRGRRPGLTPDART